MLYTIAVVLLILWVLGLVSSYTLGGFIHILLVFAVVMNKDVYDGMPDDLKQIVDSVSGEYGRTLFKAFWEKKQYESLNTWVSDMGGTLHVLSDADYAEADRLTEPVMREWIDIVTKTGLPGKAIEAKFRELETRYAL